MKTRHLLALTLVASLLVGHATVSAQQTTKPAAAAPAPGAAASTQPKPKQTSGPFHGRLKSVDLSAKSIVMGTRTFHATADTKIIRGDKPALLKDAVVGEPVSGYFKTAEDGKLVLSSLRLGPKPAETGTKAGPP